MLEKGFVTRAEWKAHIQTHPFVAHDIWPRIRGYVPGYGYSRPEIDAMFEGYSGGGKAQIDYTNVINLAAGAIPYGTGATGLAGATANIFYDAASNLLGIRETTPTARVHINSVGGNYPALNLESGAEGEIVTPTGQAIRIGHWDIGTTTFTERMKMDAAGLIYISYMSTGSVGFYGAGGEIKQDNNDLFWDAVNKRLGIKLGGVAPTDTLEVGGKLRLVGNDFSIIMNSAAADRQILILRGRSLLADGAGINLYGDADDSFPGMIRMWTNNVERLEINAAGQFDFQASSLITTGFIGLKSNAELRFYDNGNYVGFEAPALGADQIWVLPNADGPANEALATDGAGNLIWRTHDELAGFEAGEHFTMLDEDNMASDSDTQAATQQSIKAYVDAQVGGVNEFIELTDTPANYVGSADKFVKVNAVPDALEFADLVKADITDTPWAWADVSKVGSNLTDLATRQHAGLTDVTSDQHHAQAHHGEHEAGGGDGIKLDDLVAPDDTVDLDFSTAKHGLVPKGTDVGDFLRDDGTWAAGAAGADEKVAVDDIAVAGYLGAASNDGVLRVDSTISYADGGNFVTLGVDAAYIEHHDLSGLGDDDHTQYILHSLADAANDFLVASGANTFVKKTLAEAGAILEGDINHDNLQGFVAAEHLLVGAIDHDALLNFVAAEHLLVGAIDHDSLLNFEANEHVALPNTIANVLSDHNKAGHDALGLSHDDLADVSIDDHHARDHAATHNNAGADELNHDSLAGFVAAEHLLVGAIDHNSLLNYAANRHLVLPNTIANVLSDHDKAAHDALNIDADTLDSISSAAFILHSLADVANDFLVASGANTYVKKTLAQTGVILEGDMQHNNLQGVVANEHINHTSVTMTAGSGLSGGGTIAATRTFNLGLLTANWDAGGYEIRARTFESDVATGTIPLVIASTTKCTNLNADLLEGYHASSAAGNNTIVLRNASGYIYCSYLNCTSGETADNPTHYFVEIDNDSFLRQMTAGNFVSRLSGDGVLLKTGGICSGLIQARDHGVASTPEIVNVVYGTGSPPAPGGTPIGTLWIKYT